MFSLCSTYLDNSNSANTVCVNSVKHDKFNNNVSKVCVNSVEHTKFAYSSNEVRRSQDYKSVGAHAQKSYGVKLLSSDLP